jgi:hypothetical protein
MAGTFVDQLVAAPTGSAAARRAVAAIERLGDREILATTAIAGAFQDRPTRAMREVLADDGHLIGTLRSLRVAAERATRQARDRPTSQRRRDEGRDIQRLIEALEADRQVLELDNAALAQQEQALWMQIRTLREYAVLAKRLDELLDERIASTERGDPTRAATLRTEALYVVRRRRRDLLLQLAVATQGYGALRLIEQDNLEVVWAIRAATTTTATALRSAAVASQAAPRRLAGQLAEAGLEAGWDSVVAALDEVDKRARRTLRALDASQD